MKLIILGAGAWGTALAANAAAQGRHEVSLWARDPAQQQALQSQRVNARYLPDIPLPASLKFVGGPLQAAVADQNLLVLACPVAAVRGLLSQLAQVRVPLAWLSKGFESPQGADQALGLMVHEIQSQVAPDLQCGVLSGPSFAREVARAPHRLGGGQPP